MPPKRAKSSRRDRLSSLSLDFSTFVGGVILSHQAKDLADAIFAAVICPRVTMQRWSDKITQRAARFARSFACGSG
jgi:hypothetical protein